VPLLGVLPGTGGLTRVTDKRKVRHDLADIFCTTTEGVRGQKAKDWRLVDDIAKPAQFAAKVQERALELAAQRPPGRRPGVALTPLQRTIDADALRYRMSRWTSTAPAHRHLHRQGPHRRPAGRRGRHRGRRRQLVPAAMARELEDAILQMRTNELDIGTWLIKTEGDAAAVLAMDATLRSPPGPLAGARDHRPAAPHLQPPGRVLAQPVCADRAGLMLRRQLPRAGLACDRSYMLMLPDDEARRRA
jgi:benzoyl-CoA-dihydrodiol lyase